MPFVKPLLSVKYAVLKQPLAPPEVTCPAGLLFIKTVTLPPQTVVPMACEVTTIAQFIGSPLVTVGRGGLFKPVAAIDVAILPDAGGAAVGVEDDADTLALGEGVTLEVVVVDEVVEDVFELELATCGLV